MIREYRDSDIDSVIGVWYSASRLAHPFVTREFISQEQERIRSVHMPNAETWVYEEDLRVVGFIALMGNEVGAIFVAPEMHGRGIGRALMNKARELHGTLEVEVFKNNTIGRAFYDRYGFVEFREHLHEETGQRVLRMRYEPE